MMKNVFNTSRTSSYDVFLKFVQYDERTGDFVSADEILSKACFEEWLKSRPRIPKKKEESFRRALISQVTGSDGKKPFPLQVEESLVKTLRKRKVWPCFEGTGVSIGKQGFKMLGYHEALTKGKLKTRYIVEDHSSEAYIHRIHCTNDPVNYHIDRKENRDHGPETLGRADITDPLTIHSDCESEVVSDDHSNTSSSYAASYSEDSIDEFSVDTVESCSTDVDPADDETFENYSDPYSYLQGDQASCNLRRQHESPNNYFLSQSLAGNNYQPKAEQAVGSSMMLVLINEINKEIDALKSKSVRNAPDQIATNGYSVAKHQSKRKACSMAATVNAPPTCSSLTESFIDVDRSKTNKRRCDQFRERSLRYFKEMLINALVNFHGGSFEDYLSYIKLVRAATGLDLSDPRIGSKINLNPNNDLICYRSFIIPDRQEFRKGLPILGTITTNSNFTILDDQNSGPLFPVDVVGKQLISFTASLESSAAVMVHALPIIKDYGEGYCRMLKYCYKTNTYIVMLVNTRKIGNNLVMAYQDISDEYPELVAKFNRSITL